MKNQENLNKFKNLKNVKFLLLKMQVFNEKLNKTTHFPCNTPHVVIYFSCFNISDKHLIIEFYIEDLL